MSVNYNTFISNLEAKGLQTTWLADGETDFQQYGDALSSELKQEILQSFDNDQDYVLQQQIATLFQSTNVVDSGSFISACQSLGLNCSVEYQSTSYIVDYKSSQSGAVVDGAIAVYTISDGQGGEIKIADANGNGYLESEELFMNEILGDIGKDISASGLNSNALQSIDGTTNEGPSQEQFNKKVEEYLEVGFTKLEATRLANLTLGTENATYTGEYKEYTQEEFNEAVEKYMKRGLSRQVSVFEARKELNIKHLSYTGNGVNQATSEAKSTTTSEGNSKTSDSGGFISLVANGDEEDKDKEVA